MGKKDVRAPQEYKKAPFLLTVDEAAQELGTSTETGLVGDAKVNEIRQKYGPNTLEGEGGVKWYALLGKQISNAMIMVRFIFSLALWKTMQCSSSHPFSSYMASSYLACNNTTVVGCYCFLSSFLFSPDIFHIIVKLYTFCLTRYCSFLPSFLPEKLEVMAWQ